MIVHPPRCGPRSSTKAPTWRRSRRCIGFCEPAQVRERRAVARRPAHVKPELVATAPNQVWSWDITKLAGPHKWNWFHLYVILDVYSRYAVGWLVAPRESARLAEELIADAVFDHHIGHEQLTLHADRGSSMTSKTVSQLLADLGVLQSHSRPHQSNDNPFSESNFKTLKYFPTFPKRFASINAARVFVDSVLRALQPPAPPLRHRPPHPGRRPPRPRRCRQDTTTTRPRRCIHNPPRTIPHTTQRARIPQATWINPPQETPLVTPPH